MDTNTPGGSYTPPPPPPTPPSGGGTGGGAPQGELVYPSTPPKDPTIVLLLNLFLGGVGYLIMGQWQKGAAALVIWIAGMPLTCGLASGAVAIFAAIDGMMQAQQLQAGFPVAHWTFFKDHR
ncbi:MAG: hypothetical protein WBX15_15415 [Thermoanaerobaculia bacterium]